METSRFDCYVQGNIHGHPEPCGNHHCKLSRGVLGHFNVFLWFSGEAPIYAAETQLALSTVFISGMVDAGCLEVHR